MNKSIEVLISEETGISEKDVRAVIRKYNSRKRVGVNFLLAYLFSIMAFLMFLYVSFHKNTEEIRDQSIYWFFGALIAACVPEIRQIKLQDIEIEFNRKINSVKADLESKISEQSLAITGVIRKQEERLGEQFRETRKQGYEQYLRDLDNVTPEQKFQRQKNYTINNLDRWGLKISDLKRMLEKLSYFSGEISDDFTPDLRDSIANFQSKNELQVDGTCGVMTLAKIDELLRRYGGSS